MFIDFEAALAAKTEAADVFMACGCPLCFGKSAIARGNTVAVSESVRHTVDTTIAAGGASDFQITGSLVAGETRDVFQVNLTAGETYSFALRGTGVNGIDDPLLGLFTPGGAFIIADDDGGRGVTSLLTFTATTSGNYFLTAQTFGAGDLGDYTIDLWQQPETDAVGDTFAGAPTIGIGTTFGHIDTSEDVDTYRVFLEAGQLYTFQLAAGADYETNFLDVPPGEVDTILGIYAPDGTFIGFNDDIAFPDDISSGFSFIPETSGFYFLDVLGYPDQTGGYTLDIGQIDPATLDPLDSIDWRSANTIPVEVVNGQEIAYVYFGDSDENFGQTNDDGDGPMVTIDWNPFEKQQVMLALEEYTRILGITYQITDDVDQATFRLLKTESEQYGAYFFPQDPAFGDDQGVGVFNVLSGGWNAPGQFSLLKGGYSFSVMLHEFGHAHGLAHPHDNGGGSDIMLGVTGPLSLGLYNLNQGVHTVMSYNDAWQLHPDGPTPYTLANIDSGWPGTLSPFDIAQLQERYGVVDRNTGNNVYTLGNVNDFGTYYQTIWDSAGTDEIRYNGARAAQIDLTAATLDYTPTGGGVVSFVDDIWGGYTIANGVVIENATGGSGNDILIGNAVANVLTGGNGNDTLQGGLGNDRLVGGEGLDVASYADATAAVTVRLDSASRIKTTVMGADEFLSIEGVIGSRFNDTLYGDGGANLLNGGAGDDRIVAGGGVDTVIGGGGRDVLSGGAGGDTFLFQSLNDFAAVVTGFNYGDRIDDFNRIDGDKIDMSALSDDAFVFRGTARFTATGDAEIRYVRGGSTSVQIDVNGDGVADAVLQLNSTVLTANDFVL